MTMFMETTRIGVERTVAEIQVILSEAGANQILLDFVGKQVEAISFIYRIADVDIPFRLPCRWRELENLLRKNGRSPRTGDSFETWARRMAWRQILRWVEAQMALVSTNMVKVHEVFLPYAQNANGQTIFESLEKRGFAELEYNGGADGRR